MLPATHSYAVSHKLIFSYKTVQYSVPRKIFFFLGLVLYSIILVSCEDQLPSSACNTYSNMRNCRSLAFTQSLTRIFPKGVIQYLPMYAQYPHELSHPHCVANNVSMQTRITKPLFTNTSANSITRLFGSKRGVEGNPPGTIEIYNEQSTIPDLDMVKIEETIAIIREIVGYPTYDVSLIITEDEEMRKTNLETRGIDLPTDILSFQFQDVVDEPGLLGEPDFDVPEYYNLGDMMIDVPYVIRRCEEDREFNEAIGDDDTVELEVDIEEDYVGDDDRGVSGVMSTIYDPKSRIQLLLVHGILHLVGYDHIEDGDYELMVTKEEEVIKELQQRLNENWCDIEES